MRNRRSYLKLLAAGAVGTIAGCSGGNGSTTGPESTRTVTPTAILTQNETTAISNTTDSTATTTSAPPTETQTRSALRAETVLTDNSDPDPDDDRGDIFGNALAIDGDSCLVGAYTEDPDNAISAGAVYAFRRTNGAWTQEAKLTSNGGGKTEYFGWDIALDGDTAVIGALGYERPDYAMTGAAYVFTRSDGTWNQQERLTAADGEDGDRFGEGVALAGSTAFVSAPTHRTAAGEKAGAVYVFSEPWLGQEAKLTPPSVGKEIDFDGKKCLIGSERAGYVYEQTTDSWRQQAKLDFEGPTGGPAYALDGETALIGNPDANVSGTEDAGTVSVFEQSNDTWRQVATLNPTTIRERDMFGASVSILNDTAIVGTAGTSTPGYAYVFKRGNKTWNQASRLAPESTEGFWFGRAAVAIDSNTAVVSSAPDTINGSGGGVYIFNI